MGMAGRSRGGMRTSGPAFVPEDRTLCPASTETALDDVHEGTNAGRACSVISGTLCKGVVQGTFANKCKNCEICDFYQLVRKEEGPNFIFSILLLKLLRKYPFLLARSNSQAGPGIAASKY
ncbi:MAG: hypothetical protein HGB21_05910 [Nitrospirae bacterium]|nr:hypothetical protein [Nitrospirota bacterium]NTW65838.1 hypothetical protein [Nitrospirota bacterium]